MRALILRFTPLALCLFAVSAWSKTASADTITLNSDPIDGFTASSGTSSVDTGAGAGKVTLDDFSVSFSSADTAAVGDFGGKAGTHFPKLVLDFDKGGTPFEEITFGSAFEVEFDTSIGSSGATEYTATFAYESLTETFLGTGGGTTGGGGTGTGVPEPSSLMLLASGGLGLCAAVRKRAVR